MIVFQDVHKSFGPKRVLNGLNLRVETGEITFILGRSGTGKSVALKVLEDAGFYTADNLPAKLLPDLVDFLGNAGYVRVAVSIDARSGDTLNQLPRQLSELKARGVAVRVIFLEAKTETLLKRFSETRRRHPLGSRGDGPGYHSADFRQDIQSS